MAKETIITAGCKQPESKTNGNPSIRRPILYDLSDESALMVSLFFVTLSIFAICRPSDLISPHLTSPHLTSPHPNHITTIQARLHLGTT
jgi:hypothetical protein